MRAETQRSQLLPVIRMPEFLLFAVSQAVSLFGDKLDYMALLAMIGARFLQMPDGAEQSAAQAISFLSVVVALPTILFGPLAGILVDRWNRRRVMVVCDSGRALLVLLIPLLALATRSLPLVYAVAFGVFLLGLFFNTARVSIIPNLVGTDKVLGANSLMNLIGRVATLLGVFFGGLIVDWQGWSRLRITSPGREWTAGFYIDALTYLISVVALVVIFRRLADSWQRPQTRLTVGDEARLFIDGQSRMLREVRELWQMVSRDPTVFFVNSAVCLMVLLGAAVFVLYIPIIQSHMGTKGVGYVGGIGSAGLVVSSLFFGALGHRTRKHRVMLVSFMVLGMVAMALATLKGFALMAPLCFLAGLALSPINIGMDTLLHEVVPESVRGRIFSTRDWLLHLFFAVSALVIGQLTHFFDVYHLLFAIGGLVVLVSIAGLIITSRFDIP
ncbi:MAG: MFS transporter [candidate division WOR-3 bacterium]